MSARAVIQFDPEGTGHCLFTESIPLAELGELDVTRASVVEFSPRWQQWEVRPADDPLSVLFSSPSRIECVSWEVEHFNAEVLRQ